MRFNHWLGAMSLTEVFDRYLDYLRHGSVRGALTQSPLFMVGTVWGALSTLSAIVASALWLWRFRRQSRASQNLLRFSIASTVVFGVLNIAKELLVIQRSETAPQLAQLTEGGDYFLWWILFHSTFVAVCTIVWLVQAVRPPQPVNGRGDK